MTSADERTDCRLSRREFAIGALGIGLGAASGITLAAAQGQNIVVETPNWQLSDVRVEEQFRFVGASALIYNENTEAKSVRVDFKLYTLESGRLRFQGSDVVRIPGTEERRVARWWRKDPPGVTTPAIGFADVEIVEVLS